MGLVGKFWVLCQFRGFERSGLYDGIEDGIGGIAFDERLLSVSRRSEAIYGVAVERSDDWFAIIGFRDDISEKILSKWYFCAIF